MVEVFRLHSQPTWVLEAPHPGRLMAQFALIHATLVVMLASKPRRTH